MAPGAISDVAHGRDFARRIDNGLPHIANCGLQQREQGLRHGVVPGVGHSDQRPGRPVDPGVRS